MLMKTITAVLAVSLVFAPVAMANGPGGQHSFSVQATDIGGALTLTGGGSYDPQSGSLHGGGEFRSTSDITAGPLAGLRAGEGTHWDAFQLLPSSGFKCDGADPLKTAVTDDDTVVMLVRFFRQGDGGTPSFTAKVFVSAGDENPDVPGIQNVWIQGAGCADARTNVR
jgi:hypothetical protein